jgi:hypothetical protein
MVWALATYRYICHSVWALATLIILYYMLIKICSEVRMCHSGFSPLWAAVAWAMA